MSVCFVVDPNISLAVLNVKIFSANTKRCFDVRLTSKNVETTSK